MSPCACRSLRAGFSLAEIAIAMGIISFALIAILGLVPVGHQAFRASVDETRLATVHRHAAAQARGRILFGGTGDRDYATHKANTLPASLNALSLFLYYDRDGTPVDQAGTGTARNHYRVQIDLAPLAAYPPGVDADAMLSARLRTEWPVAPVAGGAPLPGATALVQSLIIAKP